jgi:spore germination protein YaaH
MSIKRLSILELAALMTAVVVVWGLQSVAVLAPTSPRSSDAAQPLIIHPAANHVQREVFGFVNAGNLGDPGVGYTTWNLGLLSTVAYFGLHVNSGDGHLVTYDTAWAVYHSTTMSNFVRAAHANGVRVIVSINLHDFSTSPTNLVCAGLVAANAQTTINEAVAQVAAAGIDGVNVNYEGTITTCANGLTNRSQMTDLVKNLRAAMPNGYIAIDTFSGAAEDNQEFFDLTGLQPYVNAFFVMAYDMDSENSANPPLNCPSYCFNPVSALNTYRFNVTSSMAQYTALVPRSKVILGQPYYGRAGCVGYLGPPANQPLFSGKALVTPTYQYASTIASSPGNSNYSLRRDPGDGVSAWSSWSDAECNWAQTWDDTVSLSAKYDLVNRDDLRGVGLFTLDYAGGAPELWSILATHFSQIPGVPGSVNGCAGTTSASVSWTAAPTSGGPITSYQVTANPGGIVTTVPATATFATVTGLTAGTTYRLTVQGINSSGQGVGGTTDVVTPIAGPPVYTGYFSWFDKVSPGMVSDNIHVVNTGATPSVGCVELTGRALISFNLAAGQESYLTLPTGIGGPLVVTVTSGPAVRASQRVQYYQSFNEVWAMSASQAATTSYINWFDKVSPGMVGDNIHVLNPGATSANVSVNLPGATPITFSLAAGLETYVTFPTGHIGGPVTITASQPVLATQRVQYYQSFNEVVARSATQAATISYFNWFDKASPGMAADNIHVLNPGASAANVTVSLAGAAAVTFSLGAGAETYVTFGAGHLGGPVTVTSDQPVLASQRVQYYSSFNEVASASAAQAAATSYVMWFDKATPGMVGDNIHVFNPGTVTANVTVSLPGANPISFALTAGMETYVTFPVGHIGGPVTITSDQPVLAAQRVQYYTSFNEAPSG